MKEGGLPWLQSLRTGTATQKEYWICWARRIRLWSKKKRRENCVKLRKTSATANWGGIPPQGNGPYGRSSPTWLTVKSYTAIASERRFVSLALPLNLLTRISGRRNLDTKTTLCKTI